MKQEYSNLIASKNPESDIDFGRTLGTARIAAHWIKLAPQTRSSSPHAESREEEFVYVVKGRPHIWINGYIYQLEEKMGVGFKAGTGVSHTVINNTFEAVELIVLGERTKTENKCAFPVNPELENEHKTIWWYDCPPQELGPHDGKVGNLSHLRPISEMPLIQSIENKSRMASFSYPEDNETFGNGIRFSDLVDLEQLGVWHEILKPQKRSAWPHAHKVEEEMAIVLSGSANVWLNGYKKELKSGDAVFFAPGTNIAHALINHSSADFEYIGLGEAKQNPATKDLINYPLHKARNDQCKNENWFWEGAPPIEDFGTDLGLPNLKNIEIKIGKSAAEFLLTAGELLYSKEAEYSLMVGFSHHQARRDKKDYHYLTVFENKQLVAAAVVTDKNLIVTAASGPVMQKRAEFLFAEKLKFGGVVGPELATETFVRSYAQLLNINFKIGFKQKIYKLENLIAPAPVAGTPGRATAAETELVAQWLLLFNQESLPHDPTTIEKMRLTAITKTEAGEVFLWRNQGNESVSMCCIARPTSNGITINGVYTPKNQRAKGYASALVSYVSQSMLASGKKFCVLYTDLANPTSNKIYSNIGYVELANSTHFLLS